MIERYTLPEIGNLWTEKAKYERWLKVELAVIEARERLKEFPSGVSKRIERMISLDVEKIKEREKTTEHDVIAFIEFCLDQIGNYGKYFHRGLTSSDVVDTALSMAMLDAGKLILKKLEELSEELFKRANEFKYTLMVGRTHGIHAEPTTLGLKLLTFLSEALRNLNRLKRAMENVSYGKISGTVGVYSELSPEIEKIALNILGLKPESVSSQVIPRDRHAEYMSSIALIACMVERFSVEIRNLQRTEIMEVMEPFKEGQKGSSAMPHKRNPILCERLSGMARMLRSQIVASLENIALWHERDISHSCVERVFIPDATILIYYMLEKMIYIVKNMKVFPERMRKNMSLSHGLIYSQRILNALIDKGIDRRSAYNIVQKLAFKSWDEGIDFKEMLKREMKDHFSDDEIEILFDPNFYLKHVDEIFSRFCHLSKISSDPGPYET